MENTHKTIIGVVLVGGCFILLLTGFLLITTVQAEELSPPSDNGNCVVCHMNLYMLHDTGNHFCLNESPMGCVYCHGGDPTAITKAEAHEFRDPHPVVGENVSRCETCHPNDCADRAISFDQRAGISEILIVPTLDTTMVAPAAPIKAKAHVDQGNFWRVLPILVLLFGSISMGIWINKGYHPVQGS